MAERDETLVTVNLDRSRPYRANRSDRRAIWAGPGEAEVPAWVAEEWGLGAEKARAPKRGSANVEFLNLADYDNFNVREAQAFIEGLTDTEQAIALAYEKRNKNRPTLLGAFD